MIRAATGFTVKSGWACAVLLAGPATTPRVVESRRVDLADPDEPESKQPYHDGFATERRPGPRLAKLLRLVNEFGRRSVTQVLATHRDAHDLKGVGIVVGSLIDPATIANDHIRIHAREGQLFRSVVDQAAEDCGLPRTIWRERDLYAQAAKALKLRDDTLRRRLTTLGQGLRGSWRAEHKAAAVAAWLMLVRRT